MQKAVVDEINRDVGIVVDKYNSSWEILLIMVIKESSKFFKQYIL